MQCTCNQGQQNKIYNTLNDRNASRRDYSTLQLNQKGYTKDFLLVEVSVDKHCHLLFAAPGQIQLLKKAKVWLRDGTLLRKLARGSNIGDKIAKNFYSSTKAFKRSDKHVESESELKKKLTALVYQLQHKNPKSDMTGRNYSNMYVSAYKLQESSGTANTLTAKKIAQ